MAAEDAALRWVAAAEVVLDPAPSQSDSAVGGATSLVSTAATTALAVAVTAARLRVDLVRHLYVDSMHLSHCTRDARSALFTAEYRLDVADSSAAAAKSRLAEANAALLYAKYSNGQLNAAAKAGKDLSRALARDWLKATEVSVAAAEKRVAAAAAAELDMLQPAQGSSRQSSGKRL